MKYLGFVDVGRLPSSIPQQLPIGRACVEHYAEMHRQCVFSNDELLFRLAEVIAGRREMVDCATYTEMAAERFRDRESASRTCFEAEDLRIIYEEFSTVVGREVRARRHLLPMCARAVQFRIDRMSEHAAGDEDEDDDERICAVCQTTLFFSAIACPCKAPDLTAESMRTPRILGKKRGSAPGSSVSTISRVLYNIYGLRHCSLLAYGVDSSNMALDLRPNGNATRYCPEPSKVSYLHSLFTLYQAQPLCL